MEKDEEVQEVVRRVFVLQQSVSSGLSWSAGAFFLVVVKKEITTSLSV